MKVSGLRNVSDIPQSHDDSLPALKLVQSSRWVWRLANILLGMLLLSIVGMVFVPWQQSAKGTGQVVAYAPQERQQLITAPTKGVVSLISPELREGSLVKRGDLILEMEPGAADLVNQLEASLRDLDAKVATAEAKADVYGRNVIDFTEAKLAAVSGADQLIEAAEAKWDSKQKLVDGYEAKRLQAQLNLERQKKLFASGLQSEKELEKLQKDLHVAESDLKSAKLDVEAALGEYEAKKKERIQKEREAQTKVDYAQAMQHEALGQVATANKERRDLEIKLSELERLKIRAPRDGTLYRVEVFERGQMLKEGDPLFTIVPETTQRAVELWISGNDVPLVQNADHVRLQFEGWPAVQFAGWPSVAVGTFGGKVTSVDATDDGQGNFRVLVVPDEEGAWPSDRYLRQGVQANGWVMLNQVPLGYEIWRQLNGFPPTATNGKKPASKKPVKSKVKLPK
ncbi:HlyD family efflux transporter periplasmic adaptor subunit [Bremerella cremea]|uniref:HlyD family efflux transporter periplasmic adaptor subunit n=1 Tax=Bremerella cremea TaxID=1031537 RepID=A0A368KMP7_9BACT|nr:HlyD family efflux transporter periplasmic adaptor subunit [Bremerella cremea]RCS43286.1 HlyD family efflux transporter periplasmic adaptor subunit [Bremerella cremea]